MPTPKIRFFAETLGLAPFKLRLQQALIALFGTQDVPQSQFGLSSLGNLHPRLALPLWQGRPAIPRQAIVSTLFNHTQTPIEAGWSVKKTQIQDFRGKGLTYDSHNGTDFAVPIGTIICAAAPGEVVAIQSEFNRGGLKIFMDHGMGLMTTYAHLARALVNVGDTVKRGQAIAISGYSGLDAVVTFPFGIPHVHFNTWLNGVPVDPFAVESEPALWRKGNAPIPDQDASDNDFAASVYQAPKLAQLIESCRTPQVKAQLLDIRELKYRAAETLIALNYYPTRFPEPIHIYDQVYPRQAMLDLPFRAADFDGMVLLDEL